MHRSVTIWLVIAVLAIGTGSILLSHAAPRRAIGAKVAVSPTRGHNRPLEPCRAHGVSGKESLACVGLGGG